MSKFFQVRTKPWKITLLVLFAFVLFLLIWLLIGDINLLQQSYIVPVDGVVWKGTLTESNIQTITQQYYVYANYPTAADFETFLRTNEHKGIIGWLNQSLQIRNATNHLFFDPIILAWMFGALAATILLPIILRLTKQVNWDVLPFTLAM